MERRDVPGNVGRNGSNEFGRAPQLFGRVIKAWDNQRYNLFPESSLVNHFYSIENIADHAAELTIVFVVHRLQIDLVTVGPWTQIIEYLRSGVAVGNKSCFESLRLCL